jgi:hypothetical protein
VIRLLFDQFERYGSINGLLHYLVAHHIRMPIRPLHGPKRGHLARGRQGVSADRLRPET